jgi:hypothetical protein
MPPEKCFLLSNLQDGARPGGHAKENPSTSLEEEIKGKERKRRRYTSDLPSYADRSSRHGLQA